MENQTIIVKKIKKGGHGHHGGAWKVAFADFAVAMMAFFLLLWLIASATPKAKESISEYFIDPIKHEKASKASDSMIDSGGTKDTSKEKSGQDFKTGADEATKEQNQQAIAQDKERLRDLMKEIQKAIEASPELKEHKDQLKLDITPEGLRIQILDAENRPMFDSGSAVLKSYTKVILHELAKTINKVPNRISLTGHTDAALFSGSKGYSNWELSADRANASRRELIVGGLLGEKVVKVVGMSSMLPFIKDDPRNAINRRIAIIVMNKEAEAALFKESQHVTSSDGTEQVTKDGLDESPQSIVGSVPVNATLEQPSQAAKPVEIEPVAKPVPVKTEPVVKPAPAPVVKPKPKSTKASSTVDLPPANKDEKQFINMPSPISPIDLIKLPAGPVETTSSKPAPIAKPKPEAKAKVKPKPKSVPKVNSKTMPKDSARKVDPPPAENDEKQFIDIPSAISPINPIKLPGTN